MRKWVFVFFFVLRVPKSQITEIIRKYDELPQERVAGRGKGGGGRAGLPKAVIADYTMEPHRETRGFNGKLSGKLDGTTMEPL